MNRKIFNYFEIAGKLTLNKEDNRSFLLGAIGIRKDGAFVKAINGPSIFPERTAHAEYRLSNKLDVGSEVYVCRVRLLDNKFALARPCDSCMKVMFSRGVRKVYFTVSENEFGVIDMKTMTERRKNIGGDHDD